MSLGTLFVDLKANVADYISGMGKAAYATKQAGRDIRDSMEGLGGVLGSILGPLGEVGTVFAETFSKVGSFAGDAATHLGKLGGAIGVIGAGTGAAVGALAAVEVGTIAIALHAIEAAAQLGEMSKMTGVAVEDLSALGFAAKQTGVNQDTLNTALEKLNKSIFAAATAPVGAVNAYTRLGIAVKDSEGKIRPTTELFEEVADKLAGVESPAARGALAMQIFGKGAAGLLPLLREGKEGIAEFVEQAKKLGLVVDGETAEAAHKFEQTIGQLKGAAEGASLSLGTALLPALQAVATQLTDGLGDKNSGISDLISGVKSLSQYFISFGGLVALIFKEAGAAAALFIDDLEIRAAGMVNSLKAASHLDLTGVVAAAKDANDKIEGNTKQFIVQSKKNWEDYKTLLTNAFKDSPDSVVNKPPKKTKVDIDTDAVSKHLAEIKGQIAALEQQTNAELKLAAATTGSAASQRLLTAANEADAFILKLTTEADKTKGVERAKLIALITRETQAIRANTAEKLVAADAVKLNQELAKESETFAGTIVSLGSLVDAYSQGGDAIAQAGIDKQLESDRLKVATLEEEYKRLFAVQGTSVDALAAVATAINQANEALDVHEAQLKNIRALTISSEIAKETRAFDDQVTALRLVAAGYLESAEAVRQAQIELKVAQYKTSTPGADDTAVAGMRALYTAQSDAAKAAQVAQEAGSYSLIKQYGDQIARLKDVKAALLDKGQSTLLVDAAEYDLNDKITKQYDAAALKVGDLRDKTRAFLNEIALDGKNFGESLFASFNKAVVGLEDQLATLVVTGKANFRELLTSLEKDVATASIKKVFSSLAGGLNNALGGAIPGLGNGAKADGSQASPLYVVPIDTSGNVIGGLFGKASGDRGIIPAGDGGGSNAQTNAITGLFSTLTSKISSIFSSIVSTLGSVIGSIGRGIGSIFGSLGGLFGGALEGGGGVSPGKFYLVGEKHPEFFSPKVAGQIAPRLAVESGGQTVNNHFYIQGVTDFNSFRQSSSQIFAAAHAATASAFGRTR